jgi:hypothetical protein
MSRIVGESIATFGVDRHNDGWLRIDPYG